MNGSKKKLISAKNITMSLLCLFFSVLILSYFSGKTKADISILGPQDKPQFSQMAWKRMEISYWIRVSQKRKVKKTFEIKNIETINFLRKHLKISKIEPNSLACNGQIKLFLADDTVWLIDLVFENRFDFCLQQDKYYSYILNLKDMDFYNFLLKICLDNEKKINPNAKINNIILRSNLVIDSYDILHPQQNESPK